MVVVNPIKKSQTVIILYCYWAWCKSWSIFSFWTQDFLDHSYLNHTLLQWVWFLIWSLFKRSQTSSILETVELKLFLCVQKNTLTFSFTRLWRVKTYHFHSLIFYHTEHWVSSVSLKLKGFLTTTMLKAVVQLQSFQYNKHLSATKSYRNLIHFLNECLWHRK